MKGLRFCSPTLRCSSGLAQTDLSEFPSAFTVMQARERLFHEELVVADFRCSARLPTLPRFLNDTTVPEARLPSLIRRPGTGLGVATSHVVPAHQVSLGCVPPERHCHRIVDMSGRNVSVRESTLFKASINLFSIASLITCFNRYGWVAVQGLVNASPRQMSPDRAALGSTTGLSSSALRLLRHARGAMVEVRRGPGETLEIGERAVLESPFAGSPQDHAGRATPPPVLRASGCTQAGVVAGSQTGKAKLGHRRRKIIATGFGNARNVVPMTAQICGCRRLLHCMVAATVTKEARLGLRRGRRQAGRRGHSEASSGDLHRFRCRPSALPTFRIAAIAP